MVVGSGSRSGGFPWLFFVIAFVFTWAILTPALLAQWGIITLDPVAAPALIAIAQFGASLAGFICVYREDGRAGALRLLKRAFNFRIAPPWLFAGLLLPPALAGIAVLISVSTGGAVPELALLAQPLLIVPFFVFILLLQGPVPEEFGWRGYALDHLQARWGALTASLILGGFWAVWHLPLFFLNVAAQSSMPFWAFFVNTVAIAVVITWLYNNTGRNLLVALLFHASTNLAYALFPTVTTSGDMRAFVMLAVMNVAVAAVLVVAYGARHLTRTGVMRDNASPSQTKIRADLDRNAI